MTMRLSDSDLTSTIRSLRLTAPYGFARRRLAAALQASFASARRLVDIEKAFQCCYSVKTNPSSVVMRLALESGMLAEVVGPKELHHALESGFSPSRIVYNGPVPASACETAPGLVFADSIEAFENVARGFSETLVGFRVRPDGINSHFGIPSRDVAAAARSARRSKRDTVAVSFHVRAEDYIDRTFRDVVGNVMQFARELERASGLPVSLFDIGGGRSPEQFDAFLSSGDLDWLSEAVRTSLRNVTSILCELGQEIVSGSEVVVAPILEVRTSRGIPEIVVDAGYPDVPQIHAATHRLFSLDGENLVQLTSGRGQIIGRSCLEYDIMARHVDLSPCREGAAVVVADTGAYDASMAFSFANGARSHDAL